MTQLAGGFGVAPLGGLEFGSQLLPVGSIVSASMISANELSVQFSENINSLAFSGFKPIKIAYSWALSFIDPSSSQAPFVQTVAVTGLDSVSLFFDRPICCDVEYLITLSVSTATSHFPSSIEFVGLCIDPKAVQTDNRDDDGFLRDIANPSTPFDAIQTGALLALGTYEMTDQGDFAQDSGHASLRKRLIRRATTLFGEFFHLGSYGAGVEVKRLLRPDLLLRYQEKLRVQAEREIEVVSATVRLSQIFQAPNVVSIKILARTAAGDEVPLSIQIPIP